VASREPLNPGRRRLLLASLAGAGLLMTGCTALLDPGDGPDIVAPPLATNSKLRVVIFELEALDLPFHAGIVIYTPEETVIFDPLGRWEPDQCSRDGHLIRDPAPADMARYLARDGVGPAGTSWTVHQVEIAVPPAVARQALALALQTPALPPLHCAYAVSSLLSRLPGFSDVEPDVVTAGLLRTLRDRPDAAYSRRRLPAT
tara:strand:- start:3538 stop:4143 length:606 start_codon:yes stop_codon:yes gene_type:complete